MPAKTPPSESTKGTGRPRRRREISGILLLAGGLFAAMSLVSNHPDHLPSQGMVARCDTNGLEDTRIHPPLLLTG